MTICIAAICRCHDVGLNEEAIVLATDHMISIQQLGQFEHAIKKYKLINSNIVAMLAGEALMFNRILQNIPENAMFDGVKLKIHENLLNIREERIKNEILNIYSIDQNFLKDALNKQIPNPYVQAILEAVGKFSLKTNILLVGFSNSGAQISEISELGTTDLRDINFGAIGSGAVQALNTLLFQKHSKKDDLKTTIYNVYKSKRNAEVAQGVGRETDIVILKEGKSIELTSEQIACLQEIYDEEFTIGKKHEKLIKVMALLGPLK